MEWLNQPEDDLLSPEDAEDESSDGDASAAKRPPDRPRALLRLGWSLVAVMIVFALITLAELLRVSTAMNNVACVEKAQANYDASSGPGLTLQDVDLARLGLRLALAKC